MNEFKLIIRLARIIKTPEQAVVALAICGVIIGIAYVTPATI